MTPRLHAHLLIVLDPWTASWLRSAAAEQHVQGRILQGQVPARLRGYATPPRILQKLLEADYAGQSIPVGRSSIRTKSLAAADNLFFDNPVISRKHATIYMSNGNLYLKDEGSTHGTSYSANGLPAYLLSTGVPQLLCDKSTVHFGTDVVTDRGKHDVPESRLVGAHVVRCPQTCEWDAAILRRPSYSSSVP